MCRVVNWWSAGGHAECVRVGSSPVRVAAPRSPPTNRSAAFCIFSPPALSNPRHIQLASCLFARSAARSSRLTRIYGGPVSECPSATSHGVQRVTWTTMRVVAVLAVVLVAAICPRAVRTQDWFRWTDPVGGMFFARSKWTQVSGIGVPPPGQCEVAQFNQFGAHNATFIAPLIRWRDDGSQPASLMNSLSLYPGCSSTWRKSSISHPGLAASASWVVADFEYSSTLRMRPIASPARRICHECFRANYLFGVCF